MRFPLTTLATSIAGSRLMARSTGWMILALLRLAMRLALTMRLFSRLSLVFSISWRHVRWTVSEKKCETTGLAIFLVAVEAEDTACGTANVASFVALSTLGNAP